MNRNDDAPRYWSFNSGNARANARRYFHRAGGKGEGHVMLKKSMTLFARRKRIPTSQAIIFVRFGAQFICYEITRHERIICLQ